ncbi:hypothetical protein PHYSODRAFT_513204 [Phytophthora sojae]|uniref:Uncharacterized protein n=1 Tax=Phytophthora sojae (strain P6497) TaxID=1094619 RepID=G4ZR34_PHYSP|nr:hypothetical protein PHYSODRAFT_513204 [Phytophthora sojae]EGZ14114.1 hypothetical protein PHYSODRAFT_513204 [Phytophthora sojae]|eukprot:XP_009531543.1 hypothetical protein PHYSODRAFT_513204 [Phytophthora sojae]
MRPTWYFTLTASAAALASHGADATPFANNPVTIVSSATSLSHTSPAFGGIAPGTDLTKLTYEVHEYTVMTFNRSTSTHQSTSTSTTTDSNGKTTTSTNDIQKLENHFGSRLELNVNNLASNAAFHTQPWPSSYWAIYLDGINYRWASHTEPSATEKYASAFGIDPDTLMTAVSKSTGVMSMSDRPKCSTNWDCAGQKDGSVCSRREGQYEGYCIPTWFGICHAWAPAALLEPEPNCAVQHNGVTFQPMDIKALISEIYDGANIATVFTGARFYGPDSKDTTDEYGRYTDSSRRDMGPGFMHVALANIIGRFGTSVVVDVSAGAEVWNQPVYSYKVLSQTEMTPTDAANQYFGVSQYPFNSAAQRIMYVESKVSWMIETFEDGGLVSSGRASRYMTGKKYTYLLELDNDYNVLGGEWVGESKTDHPDFLWLPKARPDLSLVTDVGLSYQNVRMLLEKATNC